jgi:hypothetical protein
MDAPEPARSRPVWRKSSYSNNGGNCVEVADLPGTASRAALRLVRDSKDPSGPRLILTRQQWQAFADRVKAGGFNLA